MCRVHSQSRPIAEHVGYFDTINLVSIIKLTKKFQSDFVPFFYVERLQ